MSTLSRIVPALLLAAVSPGLLAQRRPLARESSPRPSQAAPAASGNLRIISLTENGGRVDWSGQNRMVFDRIGPRGYFDVYTMNPDGSDSRCVSCNAPGLPDGHRGNPAWHPSGRYVVVQAEIPRRAARLPGLKKLLDFTANPGAGVDNTLFLMDSEGRRTWELVPLRQPVGGVLHPHFSHRGDRLFWAERIGRAGPIGTWALKLADFRVADGTPRLENIRTFQPGAQHSFYESHGFSPDDRQLLFSANAEPGQDVKALDIYLYNPETNGLRNLTQTKDQWDEHAHFSPDGARIVWMSSRDIGLPAAMSDIKTDYWVMQTDGSGRRRLTWFNEPGHPESLPGGVDAADLDWSPDGKSIVAYLILDVRKSQGRVVRIELE